MRLGIEKTVGVSRNNGDSDTRSLSIELIKQSKQPTTEKTGGPSEKQMAIGAMLSQRTQARQAQKIIAQGRKVLLIDHSVLQ